MSNSKFNIDITETNKYHEFMNRFNYENVCMYLKKNQGSDLKTLIEHFKEMNNIDCVNYIMNVWVSKWNTFLQSGGRIVINNNKYYCLSPKNPNIKQINPKLNIY